jgi:hypothetical protein
LLFRQGVPPHASYLFKHALVQDAAYGTLLREPRRALHSRIAETLEGQFAEIAESQPEMVEGRSQFGLRLAHHRSQQGMAEFPPDRRPHLRHLLGWAEPVEPRHQRRLQACRDRQGG